MTNSREMAEQAFAILQNALEESESQRLSLEQQLHANRPQSADEASAWDSLHGELEAMRAERDLWKKTSNQLQDVVSNERSKVHRLAKKLKVVETGNDRNSRKEINFWREKAEEFEATKQRYQKRIHELKTELAHQDQQREAQESLVLRAEEFQRLERMLAERDARIVELSAAMEAAGLRTDEQSRRINELDGEVRSLSQQVIDAEGARNEACRATDLIDAELKDLRAQASTHQQTIDSMQLATDRAQQLSEEYRRRIEELELQHDREIEALRDGHGSEIGAVRDELTTQRHAHAGELDALRNEHSSALESVRNEHAGELESMRESLAGELTAAEQRHKDELTALRTAHEEELGQLRTEIETANANASAHSQEEFERREAEHEQAVAALRDQHEQTLMALRGEHEQTLAALQSEHERALSTLRAELDTELESLRASHARELEHISAERTARDQLHESSLAQARSAAAEEMNQQIEAVRAEAAQQLDGVRSEYSQQVSELESELAEERNRSDNLNEIANERREALTKTTEKLEEMQERYEDAKWHLEKASHFEKLVRRRKKLIANLIQTIRARQKANNTLKAGLDSLRRYKANADERQQELLRRVELLENSLSESREKLAQMNQARRASDEGATPGSDQARAAAPAPAKTSSEGTDTAVLRNQVVAQAEVIENLESDLKTARIAESEARTKLRDFEKLHDDLETKNTFIGSLQKDIEDQQKTLAQLRKREIELRDLRNEIEQLQRETGALRQENNQLRTAKAGEVGSIDQQKIAEQDAIIRKLTTKLKEYEATITTLSEAADSWKRKYDFLAAETPYAYESASTK